MCNKSSFMFSRRRYTLIKNIVLTIHGIEDVDDISVEDWLVMDCFD